MIRRFAPFVPRMLLKRGRPIHLTYFVTARCPLRCRHCFYHQELSTDDRDELSIAEVGHLTPSLGPLLWLCLTGGEPFLRDDLAEIAASFSDHAQPRHISVVTSGWFPDRVADLLPEIQRAAPGSFIHFNVSIDGFEDVHDQVRDAPGAFARAMETIEIVKGLRGRDLGLGIATTFNALNQHQMPRFMRFIRSEIRPDHWDISLVRDPPRDPSMQDVDVEAFFRHKRSIEDMLCDESIPYYDYPLARLGLARHLAHNQLVERYQRHPRYLGPCQAGRLSAVLYADGSVAACEVRDLALGNVRDWRYDLAALWRSPRAQEVRASVVEQRCHCDHGCHTAVNLTFDPRQFATIARAYLSMDRRRSGS